MQVRDNVLPHLRRVKAELEKLNGTRIKIGIQGNADSELLMIARVHEYGATITPKATRNLCIPIHKDSYDKSPRDFQDLFFIRSRDGYLFGVVAKKGRRDKDNPNNLKFLFLLLQLNRLFLASRFCFCQLLFLLFTLLQPLLLFCNLLLLTQICLLQLCRRNLTGGQLFPNSCLFRRQGFLLLFGFLLLCL